MARLPENAPAKITLLESIRNIKKPVGRPQTTLLEVIKKQLQNITNFEEAINLAQDRDEWRARLVTGHVI